MSIVAVFSAVCGTITVKILPGYHSFWDKKSLYQLVENMVEDCPFHDPKLCSAKASASTVGDYPSFFLCFDFMVTLGLGLGLGSGVGSLCVHPQAASRLLGPFSLILLNFSVEGLSFSD